MRLIVHATLILIATLVCRHKAFTQDKIFTTNGDTVLVKVTEVWNWHIKFLKYNDPDGYYYTLNNRVIDSIVYASGKVYHTARVLKERKKPTHLSTLNTYSVDIGGFGFYSISQWYERRVWNNRIGLRVPLYICFKQNYAPGYLVMEKNVDYDVETGFAFAVGVNPKFYLNKHKVIQVFAGPEADIGYTKDYRMYFEPPFDHPVHRGTGNFQLVGLAGININPIARFNIALDGGVGGNMIFTQKIEGYTPVWRVGLSLGGNF